MQTCRLRDELRLVRPARYPAADGGKPEISVIPNLCEQPVRHSDTVSRTDSREATVALMLTCKTCGQMFSSGIQMDRQSFEAAEIAHNAESCRHCGAVHTYDKDDYQSD